MQIRLRPDVILAHRAEVKALLAVDVALVAPDVAARQAVSAVAAGAAVVATANAVAGLDLRDGVADLHHHADALVAERCARAEEVHVGAAEARVRDLDEYLGRFERGQLDRGGRGIALDAAEDVVRGWIHDRMCYCRVWGLRRQLTVKKVKKGERCCGEDVQRETELLMASHRGVEVERPAS